MSLFSLIKKNGHGFTDSHKALIGTVISTKRLGRAKFALLTGRDRPQLAVSRPFRPLQARLQLYLGCSISAATDNTRQRFGRCRLLCSARHQCWGFILLCTYVHSLKGSAERDDDCNAQRQRRGWADQFIGLSFRWAGCLKEAARCIRRGTARNKFPGRQAAEHHGRKPAT